MVIQRKRKLYEHVWPIDERAGKPPEGWTGWPEGKKFALVLTHDVETIKGVERVTRVAELEKGLGFRSSFNFIAEEYPVPHDLIKYLKDEGFEVGLHGLNHNGNLFESKKKFQKQAPRINQYLKDWGVTGFRTPIMYHNLDWMHDLNIEYDSSTFDTDPFEPQPDGMETIFPFWVSGKDGRRGYVELPYTLSQDFTLFVLMGEEGIDIWKKKLDWIAEKGGMALFITHPDYMNIGNKNSEIEEYPARYYEELLSYIKQEYDGQYWHVVPAEIANFCIENDTIRDDKLRFKEIYELKEGDQNARVSQKQTIWIDLDNSPHVPFFSPIISKLESLGYELLLTARDCSQTCGLADLFNMNYKRIGRHYGKNKFIKVIGTVYRGLQLVLRLAGEKPAFAISHGSRAQMIAARLMRIPSLTIMDYEYVKGFIRPTWIMTPEVVSKGLSRHGQKKNLTYPGIKEDVYVPNFVPDLSFKNKLGINEKDILITIRPPATEAHYHNPKSEDLFKESLNFLSKKENICMVLLPRNERQKDYLQTEWPELITKRKLIIPEHVVDGLNLIWNSDLVISGGGTMNREAAALGVPVYSIFRGKIGAVDRYLSEKGRLTLIENEDDIHSKIVLKRRDISSSSPNSNNVTLQKIVSHIVDIIEK